MKLFLCCNLRLGAECTDNLSVPLAHEWTRGRIHKYEELPGLAHSSGAGYLVFAGDLFGAQHVPESLISTLFEAVRRVDGLETAVFTGKQEYRRILSRSDVPANLHPFCFDNEETWGDGDMELNVSPEGVTIRSKTGTGALEIQRKGTVFFAENRRLPDFEPVGFEDAQNGQFGYSMVDLEESGNRMNTVEGTVYFYTKASAEFSPEDSKTDVLRKIDRAVSGLDGSTIVRLFLKGKTPFGWSADRQTMKEYLQNKVFFAEVYDNTSMDVDIKALEHDISLQSEFVRLAMEDYSLSEAERSRLISCGWSALNGKKVPNE